MDHKKSRVDQKQNKKTSLLLNYLRKKHVKIFFSKQRKSVSKVFRQKNMY